MVNLNTPASAKERAEISVIRSLLDSYRNGELNNDQMVAAIRDFAATAAPRLSVTNGEQK